MRKTRKAGDKKERTFVRRTVTLPPEVDAAISAFAGSGQFSAFIARAVQHEVQRERIARWLDERTAARGGEPLDPSAIDFAEAAWRKRK